MFKFGLLKPGLIPPSVPELVLRVDPLGVFVMVLGMDAGGGHSKDRAGCWDDAGGGAGTALEGAGAGAGVEAGAGF